ncbi:MAG: SNO glutamine amidotransferase [Candidatus Desulfovibrio kirbyi]|jgi:5'-phosphate synthase pdxT subunit|uniref:Pyridoxal 5'-phosphate synthase subunit PdxT n=1 Tax=Candidatus Desulfovibrio kirbyi TaxID=2696086 RepID=A0A6L2R694_9BACT|nr:pyridoxal 5'-phosphate synthase glutaminase subunit PdxT [Desulfovibrio sp.]GFH63057.1 MAG: SNO glutamine amidotransferase [Candidatus Desulfovibrio kirbyi]
MPNVGVLAMQGAFREHSVSLRRLRAKTCEVRSLKDAAGIDALIIPGGESTTIGKLLHEGDMLEPLKERIEQGMPVYGSCAGLILLCREIENSDQPRFGVLDATVRRNAFGRQTDSFEAALKISDLGEKPFLAVFIRAPFLLKTGQDVRVLATANGHPVAVRQKNILATSFHPELTSDRRVHGYFLDMCAGGRS